MITTLLEGLIETDTECFISAVAVWDQHNGLVVDFCQCSRLKVGVVPYLHICGLFQIYQNKRAQKSGTVLWKKTVRTTSKHYQIFKFSQQNRHAIQTQSWFGNKSVQIKRVSFLSTVSILLTPRKYHVTSFLGSLSELMGSCKLRNVCVFVQLIHRPTKSKIS